MMVHQLTLADGADGVTDWVSVLYDIFAFSDIAEGELMTGWDAGHLLQGYRYGICGVYLQEFLHLS